MENNDLNNNFNDIYDEVQAYYRETNKLDTNDYLSDIYDPSNPSDLVEVRFKNTRKGFYRGRVDFRELIKHYAREFQVKIEMRQIGSRQEAAMIGGFCSCGRVMCGALWKTEFESVKISAAKIQQLPNNDAKLIGASGKLKSCLNYELGHYIEAWESFPDKLPVLETVEGNYYPHKTDVLKQTVWYSISPDSLVNPVEVPLNLILSIARENKKGNKPPLNFEKTFDEQQDTFIIGSSGIFDQPSSNEKEKNKKSKSRRRKTNYQPK